MGFPSFSIIICRFVLSNVFFEKACQFTARSSISELDTLVFLAVVPLSSFFLVLSMIYQDLLLYSGQILFASFSMMALYLTLDLLYSLIQRIACSE